jgi:GrpB-like predicted nucleotidyltransferase (UPF0157 family)
MPAPIPVELAPHDPAWAEHARREADRLIAALGDVLTEVHHIGSTAIAGIRAKPILDLMPVVRSFAEFDSLRPVIESLGYGWWGEYGIPGRRYCNRNDPVTGKRLMQLHCFEVNSPQLARHLAFRDYLRARPDLALAYEAEKLRCRDLHPGDSHAYTDCKNAGIRRVEKDALEWTAGN